MRISFVTTIYRSAGAIAEFRRRAILAAQAIGCDYEVVLVNDASPDNGLEIARELAEEDSKVSVIDLSRNFGQHRALWTGMAHATGDLVMILDGDLEEDPMWAVTFHETMTSNRADVVYGVQESPKGSKVYRLGRNTFYRMLDALTTFNFPKDVTTARLMTRRYIDAIRLFEERELFLVGIMHVAGFSQIGVPVKKLSLSKTTYNYRKLIPLFLSSVTSFSVSPLFLIFISGVVIFFTSLLFIALLVAAKLLGGIGVEGWISVMAVVSLSLGLNVLVNGIIAIYLATIFLEVKRRPLTIVRDVYRSDKEDT
ncbi:glycosyltransferase family 2 protein [Microvirga lenta]|uniref:glycosyltransferase family 2 protein n=1 Tax=Microvirga lenta TaxID=2881337 RepID=UPI001CFFA242|nr:glycosyltransferase family 2 protein [Microvirga lenta]MCB5175191.1 glycosyltransferase family 2 protein [Microvirga lenta]